MSYFCGVSRCSAVAWCGKLNAIACASETCARIPRFDFSSRFSQVCFRSLHTFLSVMIKTQGTGLYALYRKQLEKEIYIRLEH